jgi:hypothetical protein
MSVCRFNEYSDVYCWDDGDKYILTFYSKINKKEEQYKTPFKLFRRLKKLKKEGIKFPYSAFSNIF